MTYEQLLERGRYIKSLYDEAFEGIKSEILNLDKFKLNFHIDCEERLKQVHQDVMRQRRILQDFKNLYPQETKLDFMDAKLERVAKQIFKVLKDEFYYRDCWMNKDGEMEYSVIAPKSL